MSKALITRRNLIDQAVQASLGVFGKWNSLSALVIGDELQTEKKFLLKKGISEANIKDTKVENLEATLNDFNPDIILARINSSNTKGSYENYFSTLESLRDSTNKTRVIVIESDVQGYSNIPELEDPEISLKQIYLAILKKLEELMGDNYISFHEKLIAEVKEEDYELRICYLFNDKELESFKNDNELSKLFIESQLRLVINEHSSKSFESAFIAGNQEEIEKLHNLFKSENKLKGFLESIPDSPEESLRFNKINPDQIDLELPAYKSEIWGELEEYAGQFFDFHCSKAFNRLSSSQKYELTGDDEYETENNSDSTPTLENDNSFRKFEVNSSPLSGMLGNASNPLFGNNPGLNLSAAPTPPITNTKKVSLEQYGEIMLAMLASWHRQGVFVGGTLFEYGFKEENKNFILGSVITLSKNEKLLIQANKLSEAFGLPEIKGKVDHQNALKAFFEFDKNYITFFEKVRSKLSTNHDFYLGAISNEDYENEERRESEQNETFKIDLTARKEKSKKESIKREKNRKARLGLLKQLKNSNKISVTAEGEEMSSEEKELEVAKIELSMSEEELSSLNESLELKRAELENKIEIDKKRREELQDAIKKEQEIRNQKRLEIEDQRKKKIEAEKADRLRRQQRLLEERKKREEVKQMRAKSLREAFDRAREAAIDGTKLEKPTDKPQTKKEKKAEKKKYNPDAVKMMIRFATDDKKIIKSTGISEEDLVLLKAQVSEEDKDL